MASLPIIHMTLYKHGVGYFRRRGAVESDAVRLTFRREEMDDLLKSLTVLDHAGGQVRGVDYETPQSQAERLAGSSVILEDTRSMRDLLIALRGRSVRLLIEGEQAEEGLLVGLDEHQDKPLERSLVSILRSNSETVMAIPLDKLLGLEILDETAAGDLRFFLQTALGQETYRSITVQLGPGRHDLEVSYIAPAPTWRVSYRLVLFGGHGEESGQGDMLLQGWGIFDNRLEEDLTDISLSLTAGMPISFVYNLYQPHTPSRPVMKEEDRVAARPVLFEGAARAKPAAADEERSLASLRLPAPSARMAAAEDSQAEWARAAGKIESIATGQALGELFQYNVDVPVTVGRGQSAMVPIVSSELTFKKDLIYNGRKMPVHPVATIRFKNETGLTLEHGPMTVLENGEYLGEAVLPFTADKTEAVVSYAVELGLHIKEESRNGAQLQSLQIKEGYLLQQFYDIHRTLYRIDNRTSQPKTILVEYNLNEAYTIFDTPPPAEKTLETYRYRVEALPAEVTEFTVQARQLRASREELSNLSYRRLKDYFKGRFLDKQTYQALRGLLDSWAEVARLQQAISDEEQRRKKIYEVQEQAQKNMAVLSNEGEEGKLRGRYVQVIGQAEEQLAEIELSVKRIEGEIKEKQAAIQQMIDGLSPD